MDELKKLAEPVDIGGVTIRNRVFLAPMSGVTDEAFRRRAYRHGAGLVVSEMIASGELAKGRLDTSRRVRHSGLPVHMVQLAGREAAHMAEAARIAEAEGADIVDINMGCPVPKISKHNAGCSLMRDPRHAASIVGAMARAVRIPVTVKMRAGWNDDEINAPVLARMVEDAGAAAVTVHGRTAKQAYSGSSDWDLIAEVAGRVGIPVFGSGDCVEPEHVIDRLCSGPEGVLVGRGVLRNPWILAQAADLAEGREPRAVTMRDRGQFLLDYIDLLMNERVDEASGFRHTAPTGPDTEAAQADLGLRAPARGRERWVVNKLRALNGWYSKGYEGGAQFRTAVNQADSIGHVRELIDQFFMGTSSRR